MKKNVSRWIQKKGKVLQEVSQDISWYGKKMAKKLTGGIPAKKPPVIREEALPEEDLTVFIPLTDPLEEEQELRDRLNRAIRRAFRKEGGYLYYGQNLVRYVRPHLSSKPVRSPQCDGFLRERRRWKRNR